MNLSLALPRSAHGVFVLEDDPPTAKRIADAVSGSIGCDVIDLFKLDSVEQMLKRISNYRGAVTLVVDEILPQGRGILFALTAKRRRPDLIAILISDYPPSEIAREEIRYERSIAAFILKTDNAFLFKLSGAIGRIYNSVDHSAQDTHNRRSRLGLLAAAAAIATHLLAAAVAVASHIAHWIRSLWL